MCMLCRHLNGQSSEIADAKGRFALNGLSIAPAELLDHGSVAILDVSLPRMGCWITTSINLVGL